MKPKSMTTALLEFRIKELEKQNKELIKDVRDFIKLNEPYDNSFNKHDIFVSDLLFDLSNILDKYEDE